MAAFREQYCFLKRAVSAADDRNILACVKSSVAYGTEGYPVSDKLLLALKPEKPVLGAGCDYDGARFVFAAVGGDFFCFSEVGDFDRGLHSQICALLQDLIDELIGKLHPAHLDKTGIVFYLRRKDGLSAEGILFKHKHRFVLPPAVKRRGQSRRTSADDYYIKHNVTFFFHKSAGTLKHSGRSFF